MSKLTKPPPLALYVHLPWCLSKCPYCDFNAHVHASPPFAAYTDALIADLQANWRSWHGRELLSVFFGGGTPSLFPPAELARLFSVVRSCFVLPRQAEVTLEANPGASDCDSFAALRALGVNRLSLGVQSFDDTSLAALGRAHNSADAQGAIAAARAAGFANINLDLMYGLPGQSPESALADLERALACQPEHLSWYQLNIESNTVFYKRRPALPDADSVAALERRGRRLLRARGWRRYEISAYSRPGYACAHNLNYWRFGDYIGIGAGAHSKVSDAAGIWRSARLRAPASYMRAPTAGERKLVTAYELPLEFMLNALRLTAGVTSASFQARTGLPPACIAAARAQAQADGLLRSDPHRIRATSRGLDLLNNTLEYFDPDHLDPLLLGAPLKCT